MVLHYSAEVAHAEGPDFVEAWRERLARFKTPALLKQPLVHFILAGAAVFAVSEIVEHHTSRYRIEFGPDQVTRIAASYLQQYGAVPTPAQLETLKANWIKEEILYREALALGLDQGDEIVRRRLAQKYEFLQQDLASLDEPPREELETFFAQNRDLYVEEPTRSFRHVYFSPDRGGDGAARSRAETARLQLIAGSEPSEVGGDIFSGPVTLSGLDAQGLVRVFGGEDFASDVFSAPLNGWAGPFRSGLGWHLVRVESETLERTPSFEDVEQRVREDFLAERRRTANAAALARVSDRYTVVEAP